MGTYVLMRILESAPRRYELGIRLLTLGGVVRTYDRLASRIRPGQRVLDLGCGTGAMALRAARSGARVKGIDVNAGMLEIAAERARREGLAGSVELVEAGVAELDGEDADSYDAVTSVLCFSELSEDELGFALAQIHRILEPGGLLLAADEVEPRPLLARILHATVRAPLAALAYLVTQQTTRPIADLARKLRDAGFEIASVRSSSLRCFVEIVARKPDGVDR